MTPAPKRRWLRFNLRMLMVAMTLLGLAFAWIGMSVKWIRDREAFLTLKGQHYFRGISQNGIGAVDPPAGLWLFGELGIQDIEILTTADRATADEIVQEGRRLFPEATVSASPAQAVP